MGVRKVYPRWLLMTPIACRTAFLLSRPKTAGWLIHSRLASSSASRAETVFASMPAEEPTDRLSFEPLAGIVLWPVVIADVGEGVRRRSGVGVDDGDEFVVAELVVVELVVPDAAPFAVNFD